MKVSELIEKLTAIENKEQEVFINAKDGNSERMVEVRSTYRTVNKFDWNITAIVITNIENPASL